MNFFKKNWLWVAFTVLLLLGVYYFRDIVTYLVLAWVLSLLGRPIMIAIMRYGRVGRFRIGKTAAALLTILVFYSVLVGLVMLFVPTIVQQARHLAQVDYQALGAKFQEPLGYVSDQLHRLGILQPEESLASKAQAVASTTLRPTLLGDFLGTFFNAAGNVALTITAVTFILFFFLQDSRMFEDILHALVPTHWENNIRHALTDSSAVLTSYFRGLMLQLLSFASVVTLLLWILGVPNALLIGVFGGLFNIVPYLGPIIGQVFALFITLSSGIELPLDMLWPQLAKVVGSFVVAQFLDNNILGPMIFSKSVKAHPLEIFIVTLMAAKVGGVMGMIVGIPVYTVLRVFARTFLSEFKVVQRWTEHLESPADEEEAPAGA